MIAVAGARAVREHGRRSLVRLKAKLSALPMADTFLVRARPVPALIATVEPAVSSVAIARIHRNFCAFHQRNFMATARSARLRDARAFARSATVASKIHKTDALATTISLMPNARR